MQLTVSVSDIADIVLQVLRDEGKGIRNYREYLSQPPQRDGLWGFHASQTFSRSYTSMPAKRLFLSEYDIKKLMKPGARQLQVPKASIISPLAQEWLETKGVSIEYR